eukprot:3703885-Rhodomonas_salina.1
MGPGLRAVGSSSDSSRHVTGSSASRAQCSSIGRAEQALALSPRCTGGGQTFRPHPPSPSPGLAGPSPTVLHHGVRGIVLVGPGLRHAMASECASRDHVPRHVSCEHIT